MKEVLITLHQGKLQINGLTILEGLEKTKPLFEDIIAYLRNSSEVESGYYLPLHKRDFAQHEFFIKEDNESTDS